MTGKRRCVECRFCELRVDFDLGSRYFCGREAKPLGAWPLWRSACPKFQIPTPAAHWGP